MVRIINQVLTLLNDLDDGLRQFDINIDTDVRSLSGGRRPMGPAHRRSDGSSHQSYEKRRREKFSDKRKAKKINRSLNEARRNGYGVDEMLATNVLKPPLIRTDVTGEVVKITIDRGDAMLEIENGVATICFEDIDHTESVPIEIDSPVVETIRNMGVTTFCIRSDDSKGSSSYK